MNIGVLDSGIGGTSILESLEKTLPQHTYIYQSDPDNFPFSTKSQAELKKIAEQNVEKLITKNCEIIVVACNTLTVATLYHLRTTFPQTTFIGTVPAIKKAADSLPPHTCVIVLATAHTAQSTYLAQLIEKYSKGQEFIVIGTTELVKAIEDQDFEQVESILTHLLKNLSSKKHIDGIIIGCTHFSFVEKEIFKVIPYPIEIFDSIEGITKQLTKLTTST